MEIRVTQEADAVVLAPDGSLAASEETSALEVRLVAAQKSGARQLVIDCTHVGQMTSAALRVLLAASRKLARAQGRLVLCGVNAKVAKAFSISGFDKEFTIVATRAEALRVAAHSVAPAPPRPSPPVVQAPEDARRPASGAPTAEPLAIPAPPPAPPALAAVESAPCTRPAPGDPSEALADTLLNALGARPAPAAARTSGPEDEKLAAVAAALMSALGASRG